MTKHIHIVGCAQRTGTTLLLELMARCFDVKAITEREVSIFTRPEEPYEIFCTKRPSDILSAQQLLNRDPNLWIVCMQRDPRDVIVSHHDKFPDKYHSNLRIWREGSHLAKQLANHERFMLIKYEQLVYDPDATQQVLQEHMPFLQPTAKFSDYGRSPDEDAGMPRALRGVRPVNASSVGRWREHMARVAGQLAVHGSIEKDLIAWGYETGANWLTELEGVTPENGESRWPEHLTMLKRLQRDLRRWISAKSYSLGLSPTVAGPGLSRRSETKTDGAGPRPSAAATDEHD